MLYNSVNLSAIIGMLFTIWPCSITVSTPGFHPGNRGSIPREVIISRTRDLVEEIFLKL